MQNDRRERRLAWATDDAARAATGLEPRGRIHFKLTEERDEPGLWFSPCLACRPSSAIKRSPKPAYRILSEKFGEKVLRVTEFRGDLAITVDRLRLEGSGPHPARPSRTRLQALPRSVRRRLPQRRVPARPLRSGPAPLLGHPQASHPLEDGAPREETRSATPSPTSTRAPTGSSAKPSTSTASSSPAIQTSPAS